MLGMCQTCFGPGLRLTWHDQAHVYCLPTSRAAADTWTLAQQRCCRCNVDLEVGMLSWPADLRVVHPEACDQLGQEVGGDSLGGADRHNTGIGGPEI